MIRNIVFDMGMVLIRWNAESLLSPFHLTHEEEKMLEQELFFTVDWVRLDHGTITEDEVVAHACARLPEKLHDIVREITYRWYEKHLVPVDGMADVVRELKANGYGIYLLSNAGLSLRRYFGRIPGAECFDGLMVSAEEKMLKPQHEIYEALLERFNLTASECCFIDDQPANIEAAQCVGLYGVQFRDDIPRLRRELKELGVKL